jgi:hypothetical protein
MLRTMNVAHNEHVLDVRTVADQLQALEVSLAIA